MPEVGEPAPEIALPDEGGSVHRLSDQHGRWTVVYFYPADDTPGCTTEACQFRDLDVEVRETGADVWGVSPDGAASHRRFREKFGLPFILLSDEDHSVAERYGAWQLKTNYGREYMGIQRSTVLVGPGRSRRPRLATSQGRRPRGRGPRGPGRGPGRPSRLTGTAGAGHDGPGHGSRLRPWGDTSEASARILDRLNPGIRAGAHGFDVGRSIVVAG